MANGLWSCYVPESGTNLARNPSIEEATTYWSEFNPSHKHYRQF